MNGQAGSARLVIEEIGSATSARCDEVEPGSLAGASSSAAVRADVYDRRSRHSCPQHKLQNRPASSRLKAVRHHSPERAGRCSRDSRLWDHAHRRRSGPDAVDLDKEVARAPKKRVGPVRGWVGDEPWVHEAAGEFGQRNLRIRPCQRGAIAVVHAAAEAEVLVVKRSVSKRSALWKRLGSRLPAASASMTGDPSGIVVSATSMSARAVRFSRNCTGGS